MTPIGFCRSGNARGLFVSGVDDLSVQGIIDAGEEDFDELWSLTWWFEPGLEQPGEHEYEENLTRAGTISRLREWEVEWLEVTPSQRGESYVFDTGPWLAWKHGWRNRRLRSQPVALEFATWSYLAPAGSSRGPLKIRTAQGACTLMRDLLVDGEQRGRTANDLIDARISLPRVVSAAANIGFGLSVVPRVGCLSEGVAPLGGAFSSKTEDLLVEAILDVVREADNRCEDNVALFFTAPWWARRRLRGPAADFLSAVVSLARTDFCLALVPLGKGFDNVVLPEDPWTEIHRVMRT